MRSLRSYPDDATLARNVRVDLALVAFVVAGAAWDLARYLRRLERRAGHLEERAATAKIEAAAAHHRLDELVTPVRWSAGANGGAVKLTEPFAPDHTVNARCLACPTPTDRACELDCLAIVPPGTR